MISKFGETVSIQPDELRGLVFQTLENVAATSSSRVLILPPDHTRLNSMAGPITAIAYEKLTANGAQVDILPTLGTHNPMTDAQLRMMFGDTIPLDTFKMHDWRNDVVNKGTIPGEMLSGLSNGKVDFTVDVEVNKSHFLGAVCNMETILGQTDTPVRKLFNHATETYLSDLPITYILTVMEQDYDSGEMHMRGFFAGEETDVYTEACTLARTANITLLDREPKKVVVYLDPHEFQSTWLGNKAIYRTRMAIVDDGELIVLALKEFGEDPTIDRLIRKYGYFGTPATLKAVEENEELRDNLGAAHLIHGSSEGRFSITYCPGSDLSLEEVRSVGFNAVAYDEMTACYNPETLKDGFNTLPDDEEIFYISNPALGLWAFKEKFKQ